jgi:methylated-DNA-protein-cysteine methyltransferase related protein
MQNLSHCTMDSDKDSFFEWVYEVVAQIPEGRVTSYGAIAAYLGAKKSARMVGWALNQSLHRAIPAHRVVNRNGCLSGKAYFGGNTMQELLSKEGIRIENDCIVNFEKYFWDPLLELRLD